MQLHMPFDQKVSELAVVALRFDLALGALKALQDVSAGRVKYE